MFFLASHADVLRGSRGAGTRGEPLRTSAWEAMFFPVKVPIEFNFNSTNQNIQAPDVYWQNHVNTQVNEVHIYLKCRDLDIKLYLTVFRRVLKWS